MQPREADRNAAAEYRADIIHLFRVPPDLHKFLLEDISGGNMSGTFGVQLDVTYRCNECCIHFYLDHIDHGGMTTTEMYTCCGPWRQTLEETSAEDSAVLKVLGRIRVRTMPGS